MKFGARLRKSRKEVGLSQEEISDILHISRSTVSKLENNLADLKASTLLRWGQVISLFRSGQVTSAQEVTAAMVCSVDVSMAMDVIQKVLGG